MENFEKNIKDLLENYEVPLKPNAWRSFEKNLGPAKSNFSKWIYSSAAAVTLITVSYFVFFNNNEIIPEDINGKNLVDTNSTKTNNTIDNNSTKNELNTSFIDENKTINEVNVIDENVNVVKENDKTSTNNSITVKNNTHNNTPNLTVNNSVEKQGNGLATNNKDKENSTQSATNDKYDLNSGLRVDLNEKCINEEFVFTPDVPKQKAIYEWNLGDGTIKRGGVIFHTYSKSGNYTVELTLLDEKTKSKINSSTINITVLDGPNTKFSIEEENNIIPVTHFKNETRNSSSCTWEIVGEKSSNFDNFEYSFRKKGNYIVNLTCENEAGCKNTTTQVVSVENDYNLLAPNAFTPNGDNLNDYFIPKALELLDNPEFSMIIYDKSGKLIYETNNPNLPWDGRYMRESVPAPDGIYIWVVQFTNAEGNIEFYQGHVTLTR